MNTEYTKFNFQRNGSSNPPFYSCLQGALLITFDTYASDNRVKVRSVRAVDITNPTESWRGDVIGEELNTWFQRNHKGKRFFDLVDTERGFSTVPGNISKALG